MKLLLVMWGIGFLISGMSGTAAFAQSSGKPKSFGLSSQGTVDLACDLAQPVGTTSLDGGGNQGSVRVPVFGCQSKAARGAGAPYQMVLTGVKLNRDSAKLSGSGLVLRLHCSGSTVAGTFLFGGETIGFTARQKYFYGVGQGNSGRCYIDGDAALMSALIFDRASMIAIAPAQQK